MSLGKWDVDVKEQLAYIQKKREEWENTHTDLMVDVEDADEWMRKAADHVKYVYVRVVCVLYICCRMW